MTHAERLGHALELIRSNAENLQNSRTAAGITTDFGVVIEFVGTPNFPIKTESLNLRRSQIQLLNIRQREISTPDGETKIQELATVRVPYGSLDVFEKKVRAYRDNNTRSGSPCNQPLFDPIDDIREATLEAFWGEESTMPVAGVIATWEVWLHTGPNGDERDAVEARFVQSASQQGMVVGRAKVILPETTVRLVTGTREQIAGSIDLLNCLAELRSPAVSAEFFAGMEIGEQRQWANDLLSRMRGPDQLANAICLLDSGVNHKHPILETLIPSDGLHAYNAAWGTNDHCGTDGHGTPMAGIAAYGDLTESLASAMPVEVDHHIESVKVLSPMVQDREDERLWGEVTREAIGRIELAAPHRDRVFSLQVTATKTACRGKPSSWSTVMDQLAAAANEDPHEARLIHVSAGNTMPPSANDFPAHNETSQIHDPAQAWNVLTVGACTHKVRLDDPSLGSEYKPLADVGGLSPTSTTSSIWYHDWPIKPDIVMEGGNLVADGEGNLSGHGSLSLLSTGANFSSRLFTTTGDTSAAAVQAARISAALQREYRQMWPETIRALVVHSAEWAPAMLGGQPLARLNKNAIRSVVRRFGFGVPNERRAMHSARHALTLVSQDEIQPFRQDGSNAVTNQLRIHTLPWPREVLLGLGETEVQLRVTLSYFIEPNPGPRLSNDRYRYASANLRFDLRRPTESLDEFRGRINRLARDAGYSSGTDGDSDEWVVGANLRHRGSLHSDIWVGPAANLAEKNHIAVYPVNGWWRERVRLGRAESTLRYALIVSITAPETTIDVYTPVAAQIMVPVPVTI